MKVVNSKAQQQGSAILISLVILTVLTLIGISSANNAVLGEKMASNSHFKTVAYQASKSEIDGQFTSLTDNNTPFATVLTQDAMDLDNTTNPPQITIDTDLSLITDNYPVRARVEGEIFSIGRAAMITELDVVSTVPNTGSVSSQIQGLQYILPSEG